MGYIYKLTFASGKSYIGQTKKSVMYRLSQHRKAAAGESRGFVMHAAWAKYGEPVVEVLCDVQDANLDLAERELISLHQTLSPHGYNLSTGGDSPVWSEETRARMGAAHKGKPKSAEHRAKIAAAHKGKPKSELARARMVESAKSRDDRHDLSSYWVGRKHSPEHVAKRIAARMETLKARARLKETQ